MRKSPSPRERSAQVGRAAAGLALSGALLILSGAPPARAASGAPTVAPDPAALLAQAKAAAGGEAWNALQTMVWKTRIETGGMSGSAESWEDLLAARWVDRFELGPMKGAEGFDSERPWSQDSSGQSHFEEGGDEREGAANETYRRTLSFWFPDRRPGTVESAGERAEGERRFHVLRVTPSGGRPY